MMRVTARAIGPSLNQRTLWTIVKEYEKGVTFSLGKIHSIKKPGLRWVFPWQQIVKVDLRTRVFELSPQHIITKDNVSTNITAVAYYKITDPQLSIVGVVNVDEAILQLLQTDVRDLLCQQELNEILEQRSKLAATLSDRVKKVAENWGVEVERVQMKNIDLVDPNMIRVLAKEAEAHRDRTAAIIRADGELQAADMLKKAAQVISSPTALELRRLQTLEKISKENGQHTIVIPMDLSSNPLFSKPNVNNDKAIL